MRVWVPFNNIICESETYVPTDPRPVRETRRLPLKDCIQLRGGVEKHRVVVRDGTMDGTCVNVRLSDTYVLN